MNALQTSAATIVVTRCDDLAHDLRAAIRLIVTTAFPGIDLADYERRHQDRVALAFVEETLAGQAACLARTIGVGGRDVRVAGLGGIATLPEFRGRGIAAQLIEAAIETAVIDDNPTFGFLQCPPDLISYYTSIGWEQVVADVFERNGGERTLVNYPVMLLPLGNEPWPSGEIDLRGTRW